MTSKYIALALLASCAAASVNAETYGPPVPVTLPVTANDDRPFLVKIGPRKHLAHALAAGLDAYSTYRCSTKRRTCEEGNPAVRVWTGKRVSKLEAVGMFIGSEVVYLAGSYAFGELTGYDSAASTVFKVGLTSGHGVAFVVNMGY